MPLGINSWTCLRSYGIGCSRVEAKSKYKEDSKRLKKDGTFLFLDSYFQVSIYVFFCVLLTPRNFTTFFLSFADVIKCKRS